jgi:hypothetical protein
MLRAGECDLGACGDELGGAIGGESNAVEPAEYLATSSTLLRIGLGVTLHPL